MTDIRTTTEPKSDRLNADSLIGGKTLTIKVTKVSLVAGDQPVSISFENDNGKPYYPCKSMRRVLVHCWGPDGSAFVGRSLTLYCDEKIQFGGMAVGGIRISHMSHIDAPVTMALTATRASRKPFTVKPLMVKDETPALAMPTREQYTEIADASKEAGVKSADLLAHFNISKMSEITVVMLPDVLAWVHSKKPPTTSTCESCGTPLTEGRCNNEACPNGEPPE